MNDHAGHRQRLKERFIESKGAGVANYELLELALTFAIPRRDVKPIAKALLKRFGTLRGVLTAHPDELVQVPGMGPGSALFLQVVCALTTHMKRESLRSKPLLANRLDLMDYLYTRFASQSREEFVVLFLTPQLSLLQEETLFTGTLTHVSASPREILKKAIAIGAAGIIVAHNHPHGVPAPSEPDILFTQQLLQAARALDVVLHDHVIVGHDAHYSFKATGLLEGSS